MGMLSSLAFAAAPVTSVPPVIDGFTSIISVLSSPVTFGVLIGELQTSKVSSLLDKHTGDKKITLLAPTDKALNDFGQLGALRGTPLLEDFLKFHILEGTWSRKRLRSNRAAKTVGGKALQTKDLGKILYSIEVDNGMIHVIEKVVLHPDVKKKLNIK